MNFAYVPIDEKESIINYDYFNKNVNIYTSRVSSIKRLIKILGEGRAIHDNKKKVCSMEWNLPFKDREIIRKALSLSVLLPFDTK